MPLLNLDPAVVRRARDLAARVGQPVVDLARTRTTVAVERATLRLAGVAGADPDGIPWVNRLVDAVAADVGLAHGVAVPAFHAMRRDGIPDATTLAQKAAAGSVGFELPARGAAVTAARRAAGSATDRCRAGPRRCGHDAARARGCGCAPRARRRAERPRVPAACAPRGVLRAPRGGLAATTSRGRRWFATAARTRRG